MCVIRNSCCLWISDSSRIICNIPLGLWEISAFFVRNRLWDILNCIRLSNNEESIWSCSICTCQRMNVWIAVIKENSIGIADGDCASYAAWSFFFMNNTRNQCWLWIISCWTTSNYELLLIWGLLTKNHILSGIEILKIHGIFNNSIVWRGISIPWKYIITSGVVIVVLQLHDLLRHLHKWRLWYRLDKLLWLLMW